MKLQSRFFCALVCTVVSAAFVTGCGGDKTVFVESVSLSSSKLSLKVGEESRLTATITPSGATDPSLKWKSGNEAVATVTDGVVKGLSEGTATITVITTDGNKTASCLVDVTDYHAENVVVSPASPVNLSKGQSVSLTATVFPDNAVNKNVTWTSSDNSVATVSPSGVLTAVGGGESVITATTVDGAKTASIMVYVNVPVTGVSLSESSLTIYEGVPYTALKVTLTPEDCSNKEIEWSYSETTLTVKASEDGTVTLIGNLEGTVILSVKTKDGGFESKCVVTILPTGTTVDENDYGKYE